MGCIAPTCPLKLSRCGEMSRTKFAKNRKFLQYQVVTIL
jgi:hypothetical protein